jgi:ribonuclease E
VVRSTASVALHVLRVLEDALIKSATHDMTVRARTPVALYILNQKRAHLRDLERRFGVTILVEADDTLTGANHHALERGELASGAKTDEPAEARHAGYGAPPVGGEDFPVEPEAEPEAIEAEDSTEAEPAVDEFEAEAGRGDGEPAAPGEGETNRPRRRRRRRRGGERGERNDRADHPASDGFGADAPQPTDDGLAAVAEIGGDFAVPTRGEGETPEDEERAPSARRRRGRRGRRGGGDRERFGAPAPTGDAAPVEGEPEPNLFDDPPRAPSVAEPEAAAPTVEAEAPASRAEPEAEAREADVRIAPPAAAPEAAPPAAAVAPAESAPNHAQAPAPAAPAGEPVPEPAAKADESAAKAAPEPAPAAEDPSRPRRSGWWQRARATLSGE